MARRCHCSRILAALRDDPRLATLPLAARMVFLLLAEAAARAPEPGFIPFAGPRRVSLLVSCSETEAETHLETLLAEGLARADRGGLLVPLIAEAAARSEVARRNGAGGGRPRKGETREAYLARRQQAMLLPIAGTPAATAAEAPPPETRETNAAKPAPARSTTTTTPEVLVGSGSGVALVGEARAPEWVSLGAELAEIAGMDGARGGYDFRPVQGWLAAGHDADAIREAVRRVASRPGYQPGRVTSMRYFDRAVSEGALQPQAAAVSSPRRMTAEERAEEARRLAEIEARADRMILSVGRPRMAAA